MTEYRKSISIFPLYRYRLLVRGDYLEPNPHGRPSQVSKSRSLSLPSRAIKPVYKDPTQQAHTEKQSGNAENDLLFLSYKGRGKHNFMICSFSYASNSTTGKNRYFEKTGLTNVKDHLVRDYSGSRFIVSIFYTSWFQYDFLFPLD
jgi:hypothetical protein